MRKRRIACSRDIENEKLAPVTHGDLKSPGSILQPVFERIGIISSARQTSKL